MLFTTYSLVHNIHQRPISKHNFYNKYEVVTGTITLSVDHLVKWCVPINLVSLSYFEITILELVADQENGLLTVVCNGMAELVAQVFTLGGIMQSMMT